MPAAKEKLVFTVKEKCRRCYTCVRECPAKAIRIAGGQAEIIPSRCIGCGNCVIICSQNAKQYRSSIDDVATLLQQGHRTAAILAPSFPAEFQDYPNYRELVGVLRLIGFDYVTEAAFGADLVARKYLELMREKSRPLITSSCPAVVSYIEKYHPELVESIVPVVSPMLAMGMVVRKKYGNDIKVIFIGPCIAKKSEAETDGFQDIIDAAITFSELRTLIHLKGINRRDIIPSELDEPLGGKGALFPINRGMLRSVDLEKDPLGDEIMVAEGRIDFPEALREFHSGFLKGQHLDLLCCQGCIMGPGMSKGLKKFVKQENVRKYVDETKKHMDGEKWQQNITHFGTLDLFRKYHSDDQRIFPPENQKIAEILKKMGKKNPGDELDCGACGYDTCRDHAEAVLTGLAEDEMCLPYTVEKLHQSIEELANTEKALRQSEKLATMGQLSAGIAHEVNNPLGIVVLYSHLLLDKAEPGSPFFEDVKMIASQADRCKNIISGLLNFARKNEVQLVTSHVGELVETAIKDVFIPDEISVRIINKLEDPYADVDPGQIVQVLTNIIKNGVEVMGKEGELLITTEGNEWEVEISVEDNGPGIPKERLDKLFEPFFTTKPIGKGTGLGLSVSYGIVKMHQGRITVKTNDDQEKGKTGTIFTVILPRKRKMD